MSNFFPSSQSSKQNKLKAYPRPEIEPEVGDSDDKWFHPVRLTPIEVKACHHEGGTILGSTRGGFDLDKIMAFLDKNKVNMVFIIGGDGTHRGAYKV